MKYLPIAILWASPVSAFVGVPPWTCRRHGLKANMETAARMAQLDDSREEAAHVAPPWDEQVFQVPSTGSLGGGLQDTTVGAAGAADEDVLTEKACSKRISVLQRKLRQVQELEVRRARNPGSLNEDQLTKIERKEELKDELSELEAQRKSLREGTKTGGAARAGPGEGVADFRGIQGSRRESAGLTDSDLMPSEPEDVTQNLPRKLAAAMTYCRVSTRSTCELMVRMGRVTVNGEVVEEPGARVDLTKDKIVSNGMPVMLPPPIDNSDQDRAVPDDNRRTGPLPKSERNTWKAKTKIRWRVDGGLMARKSRGSGHKR